MLEGLSGATFDPVPYSHMEVEIAGAPVRIARRSEAVTPGFHCWTAVSHAEALGKALREAGAVPIRAQPLETLRIEPGIPPYGRGLDQSLILPQTRLHQRVSF